LVNQALLEKNRNYFSDDVVDFVKKSVIPFYKNSKQNLDQRICGFYGSQLRESSFEYVEMTRISESLYKGALICLSKSLGLLFVVTHACGVKVYLRDKNGMKCIESEEDNFSTQNKGEALQDYSLAPVPGNVKDVLKSVGDDLSVGETILILESMKIEFEIKAQSKGTLLKIHVQKNSMVQSGQRLFEVG
jgi:hypothetical protein